MICLFNNDFAEIIEDKVREIVQGKCHKLIEKFSRHTT
jgi:hypothetical protein